MKLNELAQVAQYAGELLLTSGAEIYRVEDTMQRICNAYGADASAFALPTGIFLTVTRDNNTITLTSRVTERNNHFTRIADVNSFSRSLAQKHLTYDEAMQRLKGIASKKTYGFWFRMIASGLTSGVFALIFDGGISDAGVSFFIGMLVFLITVFLRALFNNQIIEYFFSGMSAGALLLCFVFFFPNINTYSVVIGSIMMQLPGVSITNAIRDGIQGDTLSGLSRFLESALFIGALACGIALVMFWGGLT